MLVKLAFVMQRLKKYLKNFCHDQQRWGGGGNFRFYGGDTAVTRGHRAHGGVPPPGKTLQGQSRPVTYGPFKHI